MKQLLQNLQTGQVEVIEVPDPTPEPGRVLVRVEASLISAGTEGHQVAAAGKSLVGRVLDKPQLVRKGLSEIQELQGQQVQWVQQERQVQPEQPEQQGLQVHLI